MKGNLSGRNPLVLVNDGDVGGLFGIHLKKMLNFPSSDFH